MAGHSDSPLSHVVDHPTIDIPWWSSPTYEKTIELPVIPLPIVGDFQITRFMVMEVIAGVLMLAGPRAGRPPHRAEPRQPRLVRQHVRGDDPVHPGRGGAARHRRPRRRPVPAVPLDGVLLRPVQQPDGHHPRRRLAHGEHQRHRGAGRDDPGHRRRRGDARDGGRRLLGRDGAAHGRPRLPQAPALGADVRHRDRRAVHPPHRAERASLRQHVRGARRPLGDPRFHPGDLGNPRHVPRDPGQHHRGRPAERPGTVRRPSCKLTSLRFCRRCSSGPRSIPTSGIVADPRAVGIDRASASRAGRRRGRGGR